MSQTARLATAALLALLLFIGAGTAVSLYLSTTAIRQGNHTWCAALELLVTPRPAAGYAKLDHALTQIAVRFGCSVPDRGR